MKKLISIYLLCFPLFLFSQNCDCESNFNWVKKTFEENDAGYSYVIENKGELTYKKHNEVFVEKVKSITNINECTEALNEWLTFFRSGHFSVSRLNQESNQNNSRALSNEDIIEQYKDSETITIDLNEFSKYLETKKEVDYEGIWVSGSYKIGVKRINNEYIGFIIEADGIYWTTGQIKFKINSDNSSTYYMRDHSSKHIESVKLLGNSYLEIGAITLKRLFPITNTEPEIERYFKAISAENPYFEKINNETVLLRIPRFWGPVKNKIDSVISVNKETILSSPNLIIDLRNNGGGSDRNYQELLPILYTNPIRTVGVEYLSTPLNNQRMLDFINIDEYGFDEEEKKWAKESYNILSEQIGSFVNLDSTMVKITTYDTIYPFPKNIGIIINENNASTAEQFLLTAKQSRKVKLFGTTTSGILDISNMYFVKSPCEEFEFGYSLTKSMRIPEMTIDDKGIQPDYYLDKSIPKYEWLKFVMNSLNKADN